MRYQLSQRADFFEVEVGLETTLKRPIINTRDEPHADPEKYRRLHVIVGDANLCDRATYLKLGTTALMLSMIEDGFLDDVQLTPANAVREMHQVSHDTSLTHALALSSGERRTALDLQGQYCELARRYCAQQSGNAIDAQTADVLDSWESVLDRLATDRASCATDVDWVAKLELLEAYRERDGLQWSSHRLQAIDLQYSDVRRSPMTRSGGRWSRRRRIPAPTSVASACAATRSRLPLPRGIRWCSIFRARSTCSGSRPSSRFAAPVSTSRCCSMHRRPLPISSRA